MPIPPSPDSCDLNGTIGTIATGEAATITIIDSQLGNTRDKNVSAIISNDINTIIYQDNYQNGNFTYSDNYSIIKVNESFKLWTAISHIHQRDSQLSVTNMDTNQSFLTLPYPDPIDVNIYHQMTNILPAGTYKFEHLKDRVDNSWFFEKYE